MTVLYKDSPTYKDSFNRNSFEDGLTFQDFVISQLNKIGLYIQLHSSRRYQFDRGESVQRCEIKLDKRCTDTGRLSIEVMERTGHDRQWVKSGIYARDDMLFYVQGNQQAIYLFDPKFLRRWFEQKCNGEWEESHGTVRKFYLPLDVADKWAITKIAPKDIN